ncbi:MAG: hypothetical protein ACOZQL_07980 [Myxococcota bacterium]
MLRGLLALVLFVAAPSLAAERMVQLEAQGAVADVDALRSSLEDWLRTMQLRLEVVTSLDATPAFARVRVQWSAAEVLVEVFRGADGKLVRRKSVPRAGAPLLVVESAALVAQTGVQELSLEEQETPEPALSPPPVVEVEATTKPVAQRAAPLGLALGAYVQGRAYDTQAPVVFGGGAELAASLGSGAWRPVASLLANYQGPITRDAALVSLQLQTVSFRLLAGLERDAGPIELMGALGGGLDLLIAGVRSTQINREDLHPRTDAAPFLSASLGVRWRPSPASAIFLRALVDVDPARRRYRSEIGGDATTLLEPWTVRPAVQLGFSFDVVSGRAR